MSERERTRTPPPAPLPDDFVARVTTAPRSFDDVLKVRVIDWPTEGILTMPSSMWEPYFNVRTGDDEPKLPRVGDSVRVHTVQAERKTPGDPAKVSHVTPGSSTSTLPFLTDTKPTRSRYATMRPWKD